MRAVAVTPGRVSVGSTFKEFVDVYQLDSTDVVAQEAGATPIHGAAMTSSVVRFARLI
jgi:hypothetical protein